MLVPLSPTRFVLPDASKIAVRCAGRFILATNVLDIDELTDDDVLRSTAIHRTWFPLLKDPLFLLPVSSSTPQSELAPMVMGLCLLVYNLGQRALRQALSDPNIDNLGKPTATPTLRCVCLMSIHLVTVAQSQQITNLTVERRWILGACRKYYLLC